MWRRLFHHASRPVAMAAAAGSAVAAVPAVKLVCCDGNGGSGGNSDGIGLRRTTRRPGQTMVVGLTGSIGMGKSTVSKWLQEFGVPLNDADAAVHKLYGPGGAAVEPVKQLFGTEVLAEDGSISRPALSKFVVGPTNSANLKKLEAVVFPLVTAARNEFIERASQKGEPLVVLDIPLLFENGLEAGCDAVIVVSASADEQRKRVLARPGMSEAKFEAILSKQVPDAEKRAKADHILDTGLAPEATRASAQALVESCRRRVADERAARRAEHHRLTVVGLSVLAAGLGLGSVLRCCGGATAAGG